LTDPPQQIEQLELREAERAITSLQEEQRSAVLLVGLTRANYNQIASVFDFAALGIPTEDEYVAAYCERTGRSRASDWEFYMVYSLFRLAAIMQGIAKRAIDGTAASREAEELGRLARPVGEQALALALSLGA
jgi:aminoglycoside phosphotransferase (APT) family kinase protein